MVDAQCMAPDCPAPAFIKNEPKPGEHALMAGGSTYHFGCYARLRRGPLPSVTAEQRALAQLQEENTHA